MTQLINVLQQYGALSIEEFLGLVAKEVETLGHDAWQTVWKHLGDHHGAEERDLAFAHAVSLCHIQAPTF